MDKKLITIKFRNVFDGEEAEMPQPEDKTFTAQDGTIFNDPLKLIITENNPNPGPDYSYEPNKETGEEWEQTEPWITITGTHKALYIWAMHWEARLRDAVFNLGADDSHYDYFPGEINSFLAAASQIRGYNTESLLDYLDTHPLLQNGELEDVDIPSIKPGNTLEDIYNKDDWSPERNLF